ncbi:hypothetical protein K9L16_00705 [Candidatus Pacearchaeota archaeon]|nr:hypothetical protein [Candidatus Pacearchaeota archaeon]
MFGLDLSKKEGVLELYDMFNKGGMLRSHPSKVMIGYDIDRPRLGGNLFFNFSVPINTIGGPYFNEGIWSVPVNISDHLFSWQFLAKGLFEEHKIPYSTHDDGRTVYFKDRKNAPEMLDSKEGKKFLEEISDRQKALSTLLVKRVKGIQFCARNPHNNSSGAIRKGDSFQAVADLDYSEHRNLGYNLENIFRKNKEGIFFMDARQIKRVIPQFL